MSSSARYWYDVSRKWLLVSSVGLLVPNFLIKAPFGRFSPSGDSWLVVDGIKSWVVMELVAPLTFLYAYLRSPLSYYEVNLPELTSPQNVLAGLFLVHYANRAVLGPLRTPSRSRSHLSVTVTGMVFNLANGFALGSYLSSPYARVFLTRGYTYARRSYWVGVGLWVVGFLGNVVHDEVLFEIRRKAKAKGKGKGKEKETKEGMNGNDANETSKDTKIQSEHYAIPQGLLYRYISYPNYLCEWIEWFGFALAAAPVPVASLSALLGVFSLETVKEAWTDPAHVFAPNLAPPWVFFIAEVFFMFPRAYNGHRWYHEKFGERYPKERRAVIPFLV
ncbi:hypothetical protein AMATHDRAFT_59523 [Amanita thiersii Skay4041]|uniref:3-oxo-5-alpha-steroid 4-dehydrogenase C-terminal domain-containing protein n=1 Tax=Amanita thiersii Skay4041 TaxID=703135 RepID=A0A2A9NJS8_9AGAR|nr:hypothetical protein AMATHDRAFT_59523 [Amanita thiersii Skay4041]